MNLYLIYQSYNNGYDTYDSGVVCAETEDEARRMHPSSTDTNERYWLSTWAPAEHVKVEYLGKASKKIEKGPVCASFNAG